MGNKIFVSYKYVDSNVQKLGNNAETKVRDYVTEFENTLKLSDHIYKGEEDGEDLSQFKDSTIESKLRDKIFDSSVTVVFISPNMKENDIDENDQWIPWEVSYSLRDTHRQSADGGTIHSKPNGLIGVVLPDVTGGYTYYYDYCTDNYCNSFFKRCYGFKSNMTFEIITKNLFNKKNPECSDCHERKLYRLEDSYIRIVKWNDFITNYDQYIEAAIERKNHIDDYEITVEVQD